MPGLSRHEDALLFILFCQRARMGELATLNPPRPETLAGLAIFAALQISSRSDERYFHASYLLLGRK